METLQNTSINLESECRVKDTTPEISLEKEQATQLSADVVNDASYQEQNSTFMKKSVGSKCSSDYPKMLNLISKK